MKPQGNPITEYDPDVPDLAKRFTAVIMEPKESIVHKTMEMLKKVKDEKRANDIERMKERQMKHAKVFIF